MAKTLQAMDSKAMFQLRVHNADNTQLDSLRQALQSWIESQPDSVQVRYDESIGNSKHTDPGAKAKGLMKP